VSAWCAEILRTQPRRVCPLIWRTDMLERSVTDLTGAAMNNRCASALVGIALLGLQSCTSSGAPPSIPLDQAIYEVENNLQKAAPVYLPDLIAKDGVTKDRAVEGIQRAQCAAYNENRQNSINSNPFIPVMTKEFSIALAGTFSATGGGGVVGLGGVPVPTGSLSFTVTAGQTQTLTVPLTFYALASLPNVYLSQTLSYYSGVADEVEKKKLGAVVLANREQLDQEVEYLMKNKPTADRCTALKKGAPPVAPPPPP